MGTVRKAYAIKRDATRSDAARRDSINRKAERAVKASARKGAGVL